MHRSIQKCCFVEDCSYNSYKYNESLPGNVTYSVSHSFCNLKNILKNIPFKSFHVMLPEVLISFVVANTLGIKQPRHQSSLAPNPSGQRNNFPRRDGQYCSVDPLLCAQLLRWPTLEMIEWSLCIA